MSSLRNLGQQLNNHMRDVEKRFNQGVDKLAEEIEFDAKDIIRFSVENTPSGLSPGKKDRVVTGAMRDNADAKVERLANGIKIKYGWFGFTNPENPGDYVKAQELGLGKVEFGMHSFHSVLEATRRNLHKFKAGGYF